MTCFANLTRPALPAFQYSPVHFELRTCYYDIRFVAMRVHYLEGRPNGTAHHELSYWDSLHSYIDEFVDFPMRAFDSYFKYALVVHGMTTLTPAM